MLFDKILFDFQFPSLQQCGLLVESVESYRMAHSLNSAAADIARNLAIVLTDLGAAQSHHLLGNHRF